MILGTPLIPVIYRRPGSRPEPALIILNAPDDLWECPGWTRLEKEGAAINAGWWLWTCEQKILDELSQ